MSSLEKKHILIIDDDTRIRRLLHRYLSQNNFVVSEADNPITARQMMDCFSFDLLVLDVMMPQENGFDFARWLRQNGCDIPVLMLTAMSDVQNRIEGLESGVDDYLAKPFEPKELLLRINSILKRTMLKAQNEQMHQLHFGDCLYDTERQELSKNGTYISLTPAESELMKLLVADVGKEVSRGTLAEKMNTDNERTIDVQVNRLRKKIETDLKQPRYLQTVRGKGYMLLPD